MPKDKQRSLPGFEVDRPTIHVPPATKTNPNEPSPCAFCGGPGDFLCDYMLGQSKTGIFTCDAPMCGRCKKQMGSMFICSRGRGGSGCQHDTTDYCPKHAPLVGLPPRTMITAEEAERVRIALWKRPAQ